MTHRLVTLMNETQVKGERAADTMLMLIRTTYLHRKHLLLPAALRHMQHCRLINRLMKAPLINRSDSIANTEVEIGKMVEKYGMPLLHGKQWNQDLKSKHVPTLTCSFTFTASMLITLFWKKKKENKESNSERR